MNITFKGIPIHTCDKVPKDKPFLADRNITHCPFCGVELKMSYDEVEFPDGKGYTRHGSPTFYSLLEEMAETHSKKSHDYASNSNPYGNYHFAGKIALLFSHSEQDAGFVGRLGEKLYRLANLESSQKVPSNESIEDTERDLCVIMALWIASRRDRRSNA
jgi:hypothetical protein